MTASTRDLADAAREVAARAPRGSDRRKAYGCVSIALDSASTIAGARRILVAECPEPVRADALQSLDDIQSIPKETQ